MPDIQPRCNILKLQKHLLTDYKRGINSIRGINSTEGIDSCRGIDSIWNQFIWLKESIPSASAKNGKRIGIAILLESDLIQH